MQRLLQKAHIASEAARPVGAWSHTEGNTSWHQGILDCTPSVTLPPALPSAASCGHRGVPLGLAHGNEGRQAPSSWTQEEQR